MATADQPVSLVMVVVAFGSIILLMAGLIGSLFVRWMNRWMESLSSKITTLCVQNEKDHDDLWKRIHHHGHRIKTENGGYATAGVIVEAER